MALGSLRGFVEQGGQTVTTDGRVSSTFVQRSFPSATVTVFNAGTLVAATIFSDSIGTPKANPFVADADGEWDFWAASGSYDVQFSGQGITAPFTLFGFFIPDPAITAPLPDPGANGIVVRTGLQTTVAITIVGTANEITVVNGDGVVGNPIISIPTLVTFTGKTITGGTYTSPIINTPTINTPTITTPTITGGTHTSLTAFSIRSSGAAFDTAIAVTEVLTANRTLTITLNDANRTISLAGNLTLGGALTTANAFITAGNFSLTLTQTGATNVTLPVTGTLATLAGTETFTNKTLVSPRIDTALLDTNGNEVLETPATALAVNHLRVTNSATGNPVTVAAVGGDANIQLTVAGKGTGAVVIQSNTGTDRIVLHGTNAELYLGDGIVSATPDNFIINGTGGSGANIAGAQLDLAGGKGTGNAIPGHVSVRYPLITAAGSTLQTLSASRYTVVTSLYTNTANHTNITNTTVETSIFTGETPSTGSTRVIEGGISRAGSVYRVLVRGRYAATAAPSGRIRVKLGAVTVCDTNNILLANTGDGIWILEFDIRVGTLGAAGTVDTQALRAGFAPGTTGAQTTTFGYGAGAGTVIDTTVNQTLDITWQWSAASASNILITAEVTIDRLR